MSRNLIVGGVTVPLTATIELSQTYQIISARNVRRFADGTATVREAWSGKLSTDIRGDGSIPAGLTTLDYSVAMNVSCIAPRAITQATWTFTDVAAGRRSDAGAEPYGRASLDGITWVLTDVTWGTGDGANDATLDVVADATMYQLVYYPLISAICTEPTEDWDWAGQLGWSLHAEEV